MMTMRTQNPLFTTRQPSSRKFIHGCKSALAVLGVSALLSACAGGGTASRQGPYIGGGGGFTAQREESTNVVMFAPLSGRDQRIGTQMVNAAKLALPDGGAVKMVVVDEAHLSETSDLFLTGFKRGQQLQIGPLRATHASAIKMIEGLSDTPTLAFTSDETAAGPNLWIMGVTPRQQVEQLVNMANAREDRKNFAAFLPDTPFGHAYGDALSAACTARNLRAPRLVYHSGDAADKKSKLQDLLRSAPVISHIETQAQAADITAEPDAVDPIGVAREDEAAHNGQLAANDTNADRFDALLIGDIGLDLQSDIDVLAKFDIDRSKLRLMGPALWRGFSAKLSKLGGAWYAAPDPALRRSFVNRYRARYGSEPSVLADAAYDTAYLAKALIRNDAPLDIASLTRATGFAGVDGIFSLNVDGSVRRELAIFEILPRGGVKLAYPAQKRFATLPEDAANQLKKPVT